MPNALNTGTAMVSHTGTAPRKAATIALWVVRILLALMFLGAGFAKLSGQPMMVAEFHQVGLGQWFRYLTGALEVLGAAMLLTPRLCGFGAVLLFGVMAGAILAHLTRLHTSPAVPVILLLLTATVAWSYRGQVLRAFPGSPKLGG